MLLPAAAAPRRVYYFHGFDPATTARYRRMFAAAADRLALELDDAALGSEPDTDDLDAIDKPGGVLRVTAERLAALTAAGGPGEAAAARRALAMLFGYAREGGAS